MADNKPRDPGQRLDALVAPLDRAADETAAETRALATLRAWRRTCPKRFWGVTLRNITTGSSPPPSAVLEEVTLWSEDENPEGALLLLGPKGVGKTRLAAAVGAHLAARGRQVAFASCHRTLDRVRVSFGGANQVDRDLLQRLAEIELVILDDLGAGRQELSDWELASLGDLIDHRWSNLLPTVVTSNTTLDELGRLLGERSWDRLQDSATVVVLTGPSHRRLG